MLPCFLGRRVRLRCGDVVATGVLTEVEDDVLVLCDAKRLTYPYWVAQVRAVFLLEAW